MPPRPSTELGRELFELMKAPGGATPAAIRGKQELMRLACVRAEAPTSENYDEHEQLVSATAQAFIEEATHAIDKPISQRQHVDADQGQAARYLLALEQGSESMPLHRRRKRAAECLKMESPGSLRHSYKRKGVPIVTPEIQLMDAIANKLIERNATFLEQLEEQRSKENDHSAAKWLAAISEICVTAYNLASELENPVSRWTIQLPWENDDGEAVRRADTRREESFLLFCRFWCLVKLPPADDEAFADPNHPGGFLGKLFPSGLVAMLCSSSPFSYEIIKELSEGYAIVSKDITDSPRNKNLQPAWTAWINSCHCTESQPDPDCRVHLFHETLRSYIKHLDECWADVRDPYRTPWGYRAQRSIAKTLEKYSLHPAIDKKAKYLYNL